MGSPAAQLLGVHSRFNMVLLIIRSGPVERDVQQVVRMVNLGESPRSDWFGLSRTWRSAEGGRLVRRSSCEIPV